MKYAVEMDSGAMTYTPRFIKFGSRNQIMTEGNTYSHKQKKNKQTNSMVWVRERTIPTKRTPLVGEVIEGATRSAWRTPTAVFSIF
jgi:hypothetical protein